MGGSIGMRTAMELIHIHILTGVLIMIVVLVEIAMDLHTFQMHNLSWPDAIAFIAFLICEHSETNMLNTIHRDINIEVEYLRDIITGKQTFRKCPACDKDGREYWDENGNGANSYPHPDWGVDYDSGPCRNCDGLAYIPNA